jgi:hypothetical protein
MNRGWEETYTYTSHPRRYDIGPCNSARPSLQIPGFWRLIVSGIYFKSYMKGRLLRWNESSCGLSPGTCSNDEGERLIRQDQRGAFRCNVVGAKLLHKACFWGVQAETSSSCRACCLLLTCYVPTVSVSTPTVRPCHHPFLSWYRQSYIRDVRSSACIHDSSQHNSA